jgi:hypothetical protein
VIFTLFKRIFKEHSGAHFWMPLVVVLLISVAVDLLPHLSVGGTIQLSLLGDWEHLWKPWAMDLTHGRLRELVGIYLAFILVVLWSVWKASIVPWTMIGDLSDSLEGADRYFAIGTIPLKEWFEPSPFLYLSTIVQKQYKPLQAAAQVTAAPAAPVVPATAPTPFRHERVLLFSSDVDFQALQASFLDEHYARSFSAIHDRLGITLAYLRKNQVNEVLGKLTPEQQAIITGPGRRPGARASIENMDRNRPFAVTYNGTTAKAVVRFSKVKDSLVVEKLPDGPEKGACVAFAKHIDEAIYKPPGPGAAGPRELFESCKFSKYLCP